MDGHRPPEKVITLPPKERVNIALAVVAGALAVLVLFTAHDRLASRPAGAASPAPSAITSPSATEAAPAQPNGRPAKGKSHD